MTQVCVLGSSGRLGRALIREFANWTGLEARGMCRSDIDISDETQLRDRLMALDFDVLLNATGLTGVDDCEKNKEQADRINGDVVGIMAAVCRDKRARFIHFSTDYVFDGTKGGPYDEQDAPHPLSVYGRSKLRGEELALAAHPAALVIRTSWLFGPDRPSFPEWVLRQAATGGPIRVVDDRFGSPTYACDLAQWVALLIVRHRDACGILHLANAGVCSWHEYAEFILQCAGVSAETLGVRLAEVPGFVAHRPAMSPLASKKFTALTGSAPRPWREAVESHLRATAR